MRQLPKPIRALRGQEWLSTCGTDPDSPYPRIAGTNIPCVENLLLIGALCFPVFLVVQFDTGIFYQVAVFFYGCLNGLLILGLGQVVTWNDLVKQFEKGTVLSVHSCRRFDSVDVYSQIPSSRAAVIMCFIMSQRFAQKLASIAVM